MKWIMVILILALVLIAGCTQQSTQYVCSDGSTVSNPSLCPQTGSSCTPNWSCSGWSSCTNGQQTRGCADINSCGTTSNKPIESQACTQQAQTYCGDGTCNSGETCQTCPQDCGQCTPTTQSITYNDINPQVSTSDFKYVPINCPGGTTCIESTGPAIMSGSNGVLKEYTFKITYSPSSSKSVYFEAYTSDTLNQFATSGPRKLSSGENILFMSSTTPNLYDNLNVNLCFSYIDFFISNYNGVAKFYKTGYNMVELDSSEHVCINKVFGPPQIDVNINPSTVQFDITTSKNYDQKTIGLDNTGNAPMYFYLWAPSTQDGTGRSYNEPSCSWGEPNYFVLNVNENKYVTLSCGIYSSPPSQSYYTETAYVYAFPSAACGTQAMPLDKAGCPQNALFKKPVTLNVNFHS
jgi:hypothetical protein